MCIHRHVFIPTYIAKDKHMQINKTKSSLSLVLYEVL